MYRRLLSLCAIGSTALLSFSCGPGDLPCRDEQDLAFIETNELAFDRNDESVDKIQTHFTSEFSFDYSSGKKCSFSWDSRYADANQRHCRSLGATEDSIVFPDTLRLQINHCWNYQGDETRDNCSWLQITVELNKNRDYLILLSEMPDSTKAMTQRRYFEPGNADSVCTNSACVYSYPTRQDRCLPKME